MLNNYIKRTIKEFLIMTIISGIILFLVAGVSSLTSYVNYRAYPLLTLNSWIFVSLIIAIAFANKAMDYRYSTSASDYYNQAPFNHYVVRRTRLIVGLVALIVAFTVPYLLSTGIGSLVYLNAPKEVDGSSLMKLNLGYLFLACPAVILLLVLGYFFFAFIMWLANDSFTSILYTIFASLIATSLISCVYNFFIQFADKEFISMDVMGFSPFIFTTIFNDIFINQAHGIKIKLFSGDNLTYSIVSISMYLATCIACFVALLFVRDPSGEYSGKTVPRNIYIALIPYVFALGCSIYLSLDSGRLLLVALLFYPLSIVIALLALLLTRKGKIKKDDWIIFGITSALITAIFVARIIYLSTI